MSNPASSSFPSVLMAPSPSSTIAMIMMRKDAYRNTVKDKSPDVIMMMSDGGVVSMGNSPFVLYYPTWGLLSHYTGAEMENYEMQPPGFPKEWDVDSTMLGPMG